MATIETIDIPPEIPLEMELKRRISIRRNIL